MKFLLHPRAVREKKGGKEGYGCIFTRKKPARGFLVDDATNEKTAFFPFLFF